MKHPLPSLLALFAAGPAAMGSPLLSIGEHADLYATVDGSVAYTDNLTLDEFDELDDFRFIVQPGLSFELGRGLTNLNASLRASYGIVRYADNSVFDTELWNVVARGNFNGPRYTINVNGGYVERQQNENDINANRELVTQKDAFAGGNIRYTLSEKLALGAGDRKSGSAGMPPAATSATRCPRNSRWARAGKPSSSSMTGVPIWTGTDSRSR